MPLDGAPTDYVVQPAPLPPDARYIIDNMMEDESIDEGSYIALHLFAPRAPVLAILDGMPPPDAGYVLPIVEERNRNRCAGPLMSLVDQVLPTLPPHAVCGLAHSSLGWLRRRLNTMADFYGRSAFEDETVGGCMENFKSARDRRIKRSGEVCPRTLRQLYAPTFIARQVKRHPDSRGLRAMATKVLDRVERAGGLTEAFGNYAALFATQREAARTESIRKFLELHRSSGQRKLNAEARHHYAKRVRRDRAAIKRALGVASAVLPDEDVRAFVAGAFVRLPGKTLDLTVRRAGMLADRGHGALDVLVTAPQSGEALAHLCTFVEETPALDQLAAFALAMQAGDEADIIETANITQLLPAGREHPLLAARESRDGRLLFRTTSTASITIITGTNSSVVTTLNTAGGDRLEWNWTRDELRRRVEDYWQSTKHIWLKRLAVFACGRRVKMLGATT